MNKIAWPTVLLICYVGGAVSAFASTTGILGALIPLAVPFLQTGAVGAVGLIIALSISSSVVDSSIRRAGLALDEVPARRLRAARHGIRDQAGNRLVAGAPLERQELVRSGRGRLRGSLVPELLLPALPLVHQPGRSCTAR